MQSKSAPFAAIALLCLILPASAAATVPRVLASIAPIHSLVASVMEGVGTPQLLLRGGESPHSFSLRPSDARMLDDADFLFWIGPALELPLARILPNLSDTRSVSLLDAPGVDRLPLRSLEDHDEAHAHGAPHAVHDDTADPHVWLSPANAIAIAAEIARALAEADPANAVRYRENAQRLTLRLQALDASLRQRLGGSEGRFAVFHDAYQYLEQRYGLRSAGIVSTHPERQPGAAHLSQLRQRLVKDDVRCLFSEPQYQPRLVRMLSEGLAIRHAVLDPLGADIPPGPGAYEAIMQAIADRFATCMQGGAGR
jgi:zinc transport system substrate-binding protein